MPKGRDGKGIRVDLGDELAAKLEDFCAAYYDAKKVKIIREAVDWYIDKILAEEPARRMRYEDARQHERGILFRCDLTYRGGNNFHFPGQVDERS
jgi:hypothetical protein